MLRTAAHLWLLLLLLPVLLTAQPMQTQADESPVPDWAALLRATWDGYKARFIFCDTCGTGSAAGLVFDPSVGHAVSEGVGYGLLMAVLMDDQPTFDLIYSAANATLFHERSGLYHWRADNTGNVTGRGNATDADQDIALALIFAQQRVETGTWAPPQDFTYGARASALIDAIFEDNVWQGQYLKPGNQWYVDGQVITNLSYFSPAWYRLFDQFQGTQRWSTVIENGYAALFATEGAPLGLAPDWSQTDGAPAFTYCDFQGRDRQDCRYELTWEAIRVPWRIGLDCLWFGEERACAWSQRGADFLLNTVGSGDAVAAAAGARMFSMDGAFAVDFQTEGMVGMWLVGALAAENVPLANALGELLTGTDAGQYGQFVLSDGIWGSSLDAGRFYYNQSLAWFGAAAAGGLWVNLLG